MADDESNPKNPIFSLLAARKKLGRVKREGRREVAGKKTVMPVSLERTSSEEVEAQSQQRSSTGRRADAQKDLQDHQLVVFQKWWKSHLPPGTMVNDLCEDIRSSLLLVELLETLSGVPVPNITHKHLPHQQSVMHFAALANMEACIEFLEGHGLRLVNISAGGLTRGNPKEVLGLTWQLINKFELEPLPGGGGTGELLEWVRTVILPYEGVELTGSVSTVWMRGFSECASIRLQPSTRLDSAESHPRVPLTVCVLERSRAQWERAERASRLACARCQVLRQDEEPRRAPARRRRLRRSRAARLPAPAAELGPRRW